MPFFDGHQPVDANPPYAEVTAPIRLTSPLDPMIPAAAFIDTSASAPFLADSAVVLAYARILQREALTGSHQTWLCGKNVGVIDQGDRSAEAALFRRAASELGAHVANVRPFPPGRVANAEVQGMGRLLGRLYDAIEWPGAAPRLLQRIRIDAGIPVYDGLATASHPTAKLANLLGTEFSIADRRRFVVQAVLLATII